MRKPGSGDPQHQQAGVEVELLGVDAGSSPVPPSGNASAVDDPTPTGTPSTANFDLDAGPGVGSVAAADPAADTVTGQATIGGRRGVLTGLGGVAAALIGVVGLLFGIDRAAPEPPPEEPPFQQPSGLVVTTTVPPAELSRVITVPSTIAGTTLPPGVFLLGEETGQWLFFGGDDTLHRLDLDNGEVVDFGLRAIPIAATGRDLVVHLPDADLVGWIPTAQPGTQAAWKTGQIAFGDEPEQMWVLDQDQDVPHPGGQPVGYGGWALVDTRSSTLKTLDVRPGDLYEEIEARRPGQDELPASVALFRPGPALSARPDAVVAYGDDQYRPVAGPGEILAFDKQRLLLRRCDPAPCTVLWDSAERGEDDGRSPIQRPNQDVLWAPFVADGQWLLAYYPGGESELIEVAGTGRFRFAAGASPAMSDDGRWLVSRADGQYVVVAVSTGEEVYRFGTPAADGPPGDVIDQVAAGFVFAERSSG